MKDISVLDDLLEPPDSESEKGHGPVSRISAAIGLNRRLRLLRALGRVVPPRLVRVPVSKRGAGGRFGGRYYHY